MAADALCAAWNITLRSSRYERQPQSLYGERMSDLIPPDELRVTSYPERPKGGQHVGMDYGVKVEHLPTGLIAIVNVGRSQHKHREMAVHMIESALTHPKWRLL